MRIDHQNKIVFDWDGNALAEPISYSLRVTAMHLEFEVEAPITQRNIAEARAPKFTEGLWEADLAELFLAPANSPRYLEINLAPSGGWWMQQFAKYRERMDTKIPSQVQTDSSFKNGRWTGQIRILLSELEIDISVPLMFNVCLILGDEPRRYYSASGGIKNSAPDFHLRELFKPL